MLTNDIMVKLGLISYSLYLIHFPIFSISRRILNFEYYNIKIILVLISLVTSIILFKFIEKPFRKKNFDFKKVSFFCIFLLSIILILNFSIIKNKGFEKRLKLNEFQEKVIVKKKDPIIQKYNFKKSDIIVIGNSHAIDFEKILTNAEELKYKNISRLNVQIFCLKQTIQNNYLVCERSFNSDKKKILKDKSNYSIMQNLLF